MNNTEYIDKLVKYGFSFTSYGSDTGAEYRTWKKPIVKVGAKNDDKYFVCTKMCPFFGQALWGEIERENGQILVLDILDFKDRIGYGSIKTSKAMAKLLMDLKTDRLLPRGLSKLNLQRELGI